MGKWFLVELTGWANELRAVSWKKNQGWLQGLSLCIKVNKNVITKKGGARERSLRV